MLSVEFLEKWVPIVVPEDLGPDPDITSDKPLLAVYTADDEDMDIGMEDSDEAGSYRLLGLVENMGDLRKAALGDAGDLDGKYVILIRNTLPEAFGLFVLSMQVGHLKGMVDKNIGYEVDKHSFAKDIALNILNSVEDGDMKESALKYAHESDIDYF